MMNKAIRLLSSALVSLMLALFFLPYSWSGAAVGAPQRSAGEKSIKAASYLLVDANTGTVLFASEPGKKLPAAGLTRLAALLVICESFDAGAVSKDDVVTVSYASSKIGGTTAFLCEGEQMKAGDLLLAAAMINAGDATGALMEHIAGSEATARINQRLESLGVDAGYTDICGAGAEFSAMELACVGSALLKSPTYQQYGTRFYERIAHTGAGETELANPNKLIKQYSGCTGIATGSSKEAGYCGVFAAKRGDTGFIAVVLGADSAADRFTLGRDLLDRGFASFRTSLIGSAGENYGRISVRGSMTDAVNAVSTNDTVLLVKLSDNSYTKETELPEKLDAPIKKGDVIGKLIIKNTDGEIITETPLAADSDAPAAGFIDCIRYALAVFARHI